MKSSAYIIASMTLIAALAGGLLAYWNKVTMPIIEENNRKEFQLALQKVLPQYTEIKELPSKNGIQFYEAWNNKTKVATAVTFIAKGFQSEIKVLYALSPDRSHILNLTILEQMETPGLGTKIVEDKSKKDKPFWFTSQFSNVATSPAIEYLKNKIPQKDNQIQAITGATISSKAIVNRLNETLEQGLWQNH